MCCSRVGLLIGGWSVTQRLGTSGISVGGSGDALSVGTIADGAPPGGIPVGFRQTEMQIASTKQLAQFRIQLFNRMNSLIAN